MTWIQTIADNEASGRLASIYAAAKQRAGKIFGIVEAMSLAPEILQASMGFYQATTTHPKSPLPRWFRELVAVHVSRLNHCNY